MEIPDLSQIWPEWKLEKQLGRGTYGTVWQAVRESGGFASHAAIKRISIPQDPYELDALRSDGLDLHASRTYLKRIVEDFVGEIRMMESFKGIQNIVSIEDYKVVEHTDVLGWDIYIRMELLTPFSTYLCDRKLTQEDVIALGCDICTALEFCARRNIIHRDIKPDNIFVNSFGSFKLGDFGTARQMESLTGGLSQKGTFNYMAPEVVSGTPYDARVDVYSLGLVLYRLLNGNRMPFVSEKQLLSPSERRNAFDRRVRGEPLPLPSGASSDLAQVILKACAYRPEDRYASAAQMKAALLTLSRQSVPEISAPQFTPAEPSANPKSKWIRLPRGKKSPQVHIDAPDLEIQAPKPKEKRRIVKLRNPWLRTGVLAAAILLLFTLAGAIVGAIRTQPTALEITAVPDKLHYQPGETLEAEGLMLTATGKDGQRRLIERGYRCNVTRLDTQGLQEVTVSYRGAEATFYVAVGTVPELSVLSLPGKTKYTLESRLETTGLTLAVWEDGRFHRITGGFSCWPTTISQLGDNQITVLYKGKTTSFTVSVPKIDSIHIANSPNQTSYLSGTRLHTQGMTLEAVYSDGSTEIVTEGFTCSPQTLEGDGICQVQVGYQGCSTTFPVVVYSVESIEILTMPEKLEYMTSELIKTAGMTLLVRYSDGSSEHITEGFTLWPRELTRAGGQKVTVSYGGVSTSFQVEVEKNPDNLSDFFFEKWELDCIGYGAGKTGGETNREGQSINWALCFQFDISETLWNSQSRDITCSWAAQILPESPESFENAKLGQTSYSEGYVQPSVYTPGQGMIFLLLPDDPGLEGPQAVTLYVGYRQITLTFELVYVGDYENGTGWRIKNVSQAW